MTVAIPAFLAVTGCSTVSQPTIDFQVMEAEQRVKVTVDGELLTNYLYGPDLEKPVLYPLVSPEGIHVTRGYPLKTRAGERADHPHHVGCWLNFGDVNGFDFWNNSSAIPADRKGHYGRIVHREIGRVERNGGEGVLEVKSDWMAPDTEEKQKLLEERTTFTFHAAEKIRIIDRNTTLTAAADRVVFTDNKEGMMALRVARAFEHPDDRPVRLTDASGRPSAETVVDSTGVTGHYLNSEGLEGTAVWGKKARWVELTGIREGQRRSIVLMDHPSNIGYPSHWHARGYGLFSVNNLGSKVFDRELEERVVELEGGTSLTFRHRLVLSDRDLSNGEIEALFSGFTGE